MRVRTSLLFLALLTMPAYAQEDPRVAAAAAEMRGAFRNHRFDPAIMNASFDRRRLDPLIVEMEWNGVRGHVEDALNRLNVGIRPIALPCEFRPLPASDDHKGEAPHHLLPVFIFEKGNEKAKRALKQALGLREDSLWDYQPATGQVLIPEPVRETLLVKTGDFKPEYRERGNMDFVNITKGLQNVLQDRALKEYRLQPLPAALRPDGIRFTTTWAYAGKTRFKTYAWRLKATLERNAAQPDAWELICKVELGERYASQADFRVVADSMKEDFLSEHVTGNKSGGINGNGRMHVVMRPVLILGEPVKAEVPPPIQRVAAKELSRLDDMAPLFADLCRKKLLDPVEVRP